MENSPKLISVAKEVYSDLLINVSRMYNYCNYQDVIPYEDLLINTNHYIQAMVFNVALADNLLKDSEIKFIHLISENNDIFKDVNFDKYDEMSENEKLSIINLASSYLKDVPEFVKLSFAADKKASSELKIVKPTYCQIVYDSLVRLTFYVRFVDEDVLKVEDIEAKEVLKPIVAYYKSHYAKYAPSRSDN